MNIINGSGLVENLRNLNVFPENISGLILIADRKAASLHGQKLVKSLKTFNKPLINIEIEAIENNKSFKQVEKIVKHLLDKDINRKYLVINFGGGIVSDIGGFTASILFRGVPYINIPTTLLSQVDAALGGKTGVNFRTGNILYKNMLGVINNPLAVISDTDMLTTLPNKEIKNGLGEMYKYSLISEKIRIGDLINIKDGFQDKKLVGKLVAECQNIKMEIVSQDLYDSLGIREKLNLGHTIGHGIESASDGKLSHGQAVAIGIASVTKISMAKGMLPDKAGKEIIGNISRLGLPVSIGKLNRENILSSMKLDKKNGTFVLIKNIGELITGQKVDELLVRSTLKEMSL